MPRIKQYKLIRFRVPGKYSTFVPAEDFIDILREQVRQVIAEQPNYTDSYGEYDGALKVISARYSMIDGSSEESAYKRLTRYLNNNVSEVVDLGAADNYLMATTGKDIVTTDLPVFPSTRASARAQIQGWMEDKGVTMTDAEIEQLANSLYKFTVGYINGPRVMGDRAAIQRANKRAAMTRDRRMRAYRNGHRDTPHRTKGHAGQKRPSHGSGVEYIAA